MTLTIKRRIMSPLPPTHWTDEDPITEVIDTNAFRAMQKRYGKHDGYIHAMTGALIGWIFIGRIKGDDGLSYRTRTRVYFR